MKNFKYISILFLVIVLSTMSCQDDKFIEENPTTFYTIDNAFSTSNQVDQVLLSIYSHIRDLWCNPSSTQWIFDFRGRGTDMYDVAVIRKANSFSDYGNINPDHGSFYEIYTTWYYVIARANLALYASELPQISWSSATEKAFVVAQARFFRAFAYRNLAELYGGVPIVTEISTVPRYNFERATRIETYQFAINEMEAIENDIPETTVKGGLLVRGAVQHNLSELYLALGTQLASDGNSSGAQAAFTKSVSFADKVINGGKYALMSARFGKRKAEISYAIDIYKSGTFTPVNKVDTIRYFANYYWDLFQEGNVNYQDGNTECIWAAQIDYDAYKAEDKKSVLPYSGNFGPVFRDIAKTHILGQIEDVGGRGISLANITDYTRDLIYSDKFGKDMRNSETVFRRRFKGNVPTSPYYLKDVPWSVMYTGITDAATLNNRSEIYPVSCKIATDKYTGLADGQNRSSLFRDEYIIRLPETILLRAEAKQRLGDKAGAAADVNLLRARAKCTYLVTAADMDDKFNTILDERARELVYEECRWNTLLRMGSTIAVERIRQYAFWPETKATLTFDYNLWPIPQKVIDSNLDVKLEQNPGWTNR